MADKVQGILSFLILANKLCVKALSAKNEASLRFVILNDTVNAVRYDRAYLWGLTAKQPEFLGVSGQAGNKKTEHIKQWELVIAKIEDKAKGQALPSSFMEGAELAGLKDSLNSALYWIPLKHEDQLLGGILLQIWPHPGQIQAAAFPHDVMNYLQDFLFPVYSAVWSKLSRRFSFRKILREKRNVLISAAAILIAGVFVNVPLRIVAPCEIVPADPFVITAPVEGIIASVDVKPGEAVKENRELFRYDNRIPLQDYRVAQKQVEILQAEFNKTLAQGLKDSKKYDEITVINLKLAKEKLASELAKYQLDRDIVTSPVPGIVVLDNPDEWRGKPVKIGEKVLVISNPGKTKIKIWIPESDNILFDQTDPVRIILNVDPQQTWYGSFAYVSNELSIHKNVPSYMAEADWLDLQPPHAKLGLQGTAILYGEKVSLYYYIFRKPLGTLRRFLGI